MHVLGSCKRFKRNQLIPSKPYFLNFFKYVTWASAMLKRIKYNIIHEVSPQGRWTWLNWARKKCVTKTGINISPPSMHGACSMHVSNWYFPLLVDVVGLGISIPKHSLFLFAFCCCCCCLKDIGQWSPFVEMSWSQVQEIQVVTKW